MPALESSHEPQSDGREKSRAGDSDLFVGGGDSSFRLGNIGAPFQQFGRKPGGGTGGMAGSGAGSKLKRGSRLSDEDRDGVLKLVARGSNVNVLGARLFELRGGQVHVFPGSDAALKTALRELQSLVKGVDIGIKQLLLRIQSAQGQVIQGKFRMQAEANRFQIRGRGLRQRAAGFHGVPDASPGVRLVGDISRKDQIRIIGGRSGPAQRLIGRLAVLRWPIRWP